MTLRPAAISRADTHSSRARRTGQAMAAAVIGLNLVLADLAVADAQTGRPLTADDWRDRIPVVIGAIIVVFIVNGIGLFFIMRSRDQERRGEA